MYLCSINNIVIISSNIQISISLTVTGLIHFDSGWLIVETYTFFINSSMKIHDVNHHLHSR